eukprot:IDg16973t1
MWLLVLCAHRIWHGSRFLQRCGTHFRHCMKTRACAQFMDKMHALHRRTGSFTEMLRNGRAEAAPPLHGTALAHTCGEHWLCGDIANSSQIGAQLPVGTGGVAKLTATVCRCPLQAYQRIQQVYPQCVFVLAACT